MLQSLSVVQAQLLDLARDGVAADAQPQRSLDAPAAGDLERGLNQLALELAGQRVPDLGVARFEQPPKSWSWWDYRNLAFRKNQGLRIDHILVSEALRPQVAACLIDKLPRKNERPSDHAPVLVELTG